MEKQEEEVLTDLQIKADLERKALSMDMSLEELINHLFPVLHKPATIELFWEFVKECLEDHTFNNPKDGYELFQSIVAWLFISLCLLSIVFIAVIGVHLLRALV
jgi:hypothetical protein